MIFATGNPSSVRRRNHVDGGRSLLLMDLALERENVADGFGGLKGRETTVERPVTRELGAGILA